MKKVFLILLLFLITTSCNKKKKSDFLSRIHTPNLEIDFYKPLGTTTLKKHIQDFEKIDWKKDFWTEFESNNFNNTDIEVLNKRDSRYLSISTAPRNSNDFQFIIGYGTHKKTKNANSPFRKIKLYMTESNDYRSSKKIHSIIF